MIDHLDFGPNDDDEEGNAGLPDDRGNPDDRGSPDDRGNPDDR